MFLDRAQAAAELADKFKGRGLRDPLVLAIPRGGVVTGAVLAKELGADLDVVLSRKLRAPGQAELAIGAVSESGDVYLNPMFDEAQSAAFRGYLDGEREHQLAEVRRRVRLFRQVRPRAPVAGRSVIVTDDGVATGSTMIAALQSVRQRGPAELIVAVPVAPADGLAELRRWCDEVVCLYVPEEFWAVGQFYAEFPQVEDEEALALLRPFAPAGSPGG